MANDGKSGDHLCRLAVPCLDWDYLGDRERLEGRNHLCVRNLRYHGRIVSTAFYSDSSSIINSVDAENFIPVTLGAY